MTMADGELPPEHKPLVKIDVERRDEIFFVKMSVAGIDIEQFQMNMDEVINLKLDLKDSVDAISRVTEIDPCPLCKGKVLLRPKIPILPFEFVGGRFVCTDCKMSMDSPFKTYVASVSWWNSGRKPCGFRKQLTE